MNIAADMVSAHSKTDECEKIEELARAAVRDGFTTFVVGRENAPTALIATYEWPEHDLLDIVVIPLGGEAVAARLPRGQWDTAWSVWIGSPLTATWKALTMRHPDQPDAPCEVLEAPAVLRLAEQTPLTITEPKPEQVRNRALRLGQERHYPEKTKEMVRGFFDLIDAHRTSIGFAALFANEDEHGVDGALIMPGCPEAVGRTPIALLTDSLFDSIADVRHAPRRSWYHEEDQTAVVEGDVTFTRHNGTTLTERFCVVLDFLYLNGVPWITRWSVTGDYHKLVEEAAPNPQDAKAITASA